MKTNSQSGSLDANPVLMIYTSHRLDCLSLCFKCLEQHTDVSRFKKIYVIANAVSLDHLLVARSFCKRHDNAELLSCAPRGLVPAVMATVNSILEKHPDDLIMKIDEDLFVTPGWMDALLETHFAHEDRDDILLTAGLAPISGNGHRLLNDFVQEHFPEVYRRYASCTAPLNKNKFYHRYIWEAVVDQGFSVKYAEVEDRKYLYEDSIVINCILFDRRLRDKVYPFSTEKDEKTGMGCVDELAINRALKGDFKVVIPSNPMVHHYSHWRSEEYLRRHVPLQRVSSFMNSLSEDTEVATVAMEAVG